MNTAHGHWGSDPSKWIIQKTAFGPWGVFSPREGWMWAYSSFHEARKAFIELSATATERTA